MNWFLNRLFIFIFCLLANLLQAQDLRRDTSYTLHSAYQKLVKKYPGVTIARSGVEQLVDSETDLVYRKVGERALKCDLYQPVNHEGLLPGVVLIHGGGWKTGDKSMMKAMAEQVAAAGYIVICPEYRLSPEAAYPAAVVDLFSAIRWMQSEHEKLELDKNRLAVIGCSAGGQLAALLGTTYQDAKYRDEYFPNENQQIQAIVDIDGVLAFHHPISEEGKMAADWLGGSYDQIPATWDEASAMYHVDANTPPTLFIGSSYPRFLAGMEEYRKTTESYGIYTDYQAFNDAPHSFWLVNPWYTDTMKWTIAFLNKKLKNKE